MPKKVSNNWTKVKPYHPGIYFNRSAGSKEEPRRVQVIKRKGALVLRSGMGEFNGKKLDRYVLDRLSKNDIQEWSYQPPASKRKNYVAK